jgi:hypothetical protein
MFFHRLFLQCHCLQMFDGFQIILCSTLNPSIAFGAIVLPASIYSLLKVCFLLDTEFASEWLAFFLLILLVVFNQRQMWSCGNLSTTASCAHVSFGSFIQVFVIKPYLLKRRRRKTIEQRRLTITKVCAVFLLCHRCSKIQSWHSLVVH